MKYTIKHYYTFNKYYRPTLHTHLMFVSNYSAVQNACYSKNPEYDELHDKTNLDLSHVSKDSVFFINCITKIMHMTTKI
jgi:hypothetical protein